MAAPRSFQLIFLGDVMLGRLIDQLLPSHVDESEEAHIVSKMKRSDPTLQNYTPVTPWGNVLPLLQSSDLNIINLETAVTTHPIKWPNKVFNYRMHPQNIECLRQAKIAYASCANNHSLDFSENGLVETVQSLRAAGVQYAGAGLTAEESQRPASVPILNSKSATDDDHLVDIYSAADHPSDWSRVPTFHFIDYSQATKDRLRKLSKRYNEASIASLRVFSVHWGPNYSWQPADEIRDMAHFLIDECGIDIVHGHSSHHVQGIERYRPGKLIIYGCGDFVDDYALTPEYRNDLSAVWRVTVEEKGGENAKPSLALRRLEIFPTRIQRFRAHLLEGNDPDHEWVCRKITSLSEELGEEGLFKTGSEGQLTIDI
ncbi:MAG: hypothetical protein M1820_010744 [Bogoriella megaspora]|nr:MAG: hypothetical protein M1820_010744 [Bogoriella megaspora]